MIVQSLFAAFAAVAIGSALMVILHRNAVTSALFLVLAFCALAGIYLLMGAEFIGMVQIIVYAGAIMVLFLFVIMYLNLKQDVETGVQVALRRGFGWILAGVLLAQGTLLLARGWFPGPAAPETLPPPRGNTEAIGEVLFTRFLFPFEVIAMVLLVAMVGVIVIGKGLKSRSGEGEP